jgi:hypothetical protein
MAVQLVVSLVLTVGQRSAQVVAVGLACFVCLLGEAQEWKVLVRRAEAPLVQAFL